MASALIGHMDCPVCAHKDAHVREDKNGHAYMFCRDGCNQQLFTRDPHRNKLLRAKMRPVSVTDPVTEKPAEKQEPIKQALEPKKPAPVPTPQPATKNPPAGESAPPAVKKKSSWFTPILAGSDD